MVCLFKLRYQTDKINFKTSQKRLRPKMYRTSIHNTRFLNSLFTSYNLRNISDRSFKNIHHFSMRLLNVENTNGEIIKIRWSTAAAYSSNKKFSFCTIAYKSQSISRNNIDRLQLTSKVNATYG